MVKKKTTSYYQAKRSPEALELMKRPNEYILFSKIAYRAKRTNSFSVHDLEVGEAMIGDYKSIGLTEQKYRTAKKNLEKWGLITTRATNRGTIAKIINSDVFDINIETNNEQANRRETDRQRSDNDQITTNNNDKKKRRERNNIKSTKGLIASAPDTFPVTEQMKIYAQSKGYIASIEDLTESFLIHHRAKGSKFRCWYSAWQKWLRNQIEWYPEKNLPPGESIKPKIEPKTYAQAQDAERRDIALSLLKEQENESNTKNDQQGVEKAVGLLPPS